MRSAQRPKSVARQRSALGRGTQFIVVRHGETAWNAEGRIQGHLDSPLNEEGLGQAVLLADRLAHQRFSRLYSSDLGRALQTAQPISDHSGRAVHADMRLRERNLGIFQGHTGAQCERRWPKHYAGFRSRDPERLDQDCYEAFNIQVQGLARRYERFGSFALLQLPSSPTTTNSGGSTTSDD